MLVRNCAFLFLQIFSNFWDLTGGLFIIFRLLWICWYLSQLILFLNYNCALGPWDRYLHHKLQRMQAVSFEFRSKPPQRLWFLDFAHWNVSLDLVDGLKFLSVWYGSDRQLHLNNLFMFLSRSFSQKTNWSLPHGFYEHFLFQLGILFWRCFKSQLLKTLTLTLPISWYLESWNGLD